LKLYDFPAAANCQRVTLYLAEKGLQIPRVHVDIHSLQHKSTEFLRKNPAGKIPVLETDDGAFIAESAAIVEYLEELFPQPAMIGATALERARVRGLERIASEAFGLLGTYAAHTHPYFATRPGRPVVQSTDIGSDSHDRAMPLLRLLNDQLAEHSFLASDEPTVADCTLFAGLRFALRFGFTELPELTRLHAWFERFSSRPSARQLPPQ
jgi:glutathione S-transferase